MVSSPRPELRHRGGVSPPMPSDVRLMSSPVLFFIGFSSPQRCTYCVVPLTRGKEQSRTPEAIKREMTSLGEAGYKEASGLGPKGEGTMQKRPIESPSRRKRAARASGSPFFSPSTRRDLSPFASPSQVTLLGQNIDAYGRDLPGSASDGSGETSGGARRSKAAWVRTARLTRARGRARRRNNSPSPFRVLAPFFFFFFQV